MPERVLLGVVTNSRLTVLQKILEAKEHQNNWKPKFLGSPVMYSIVPKVNFEVNDYSEVGDQSVVSVTVRPVLRSTTAVGLTSKLSAPDNVIPEWDFP